MPITQERMERILSAAESATRRWDIIERVLANFETISPDISEARALAHQAREESDFGLMQRAYELAFRAIQAVLDIIRDNRLPLDAVKVLVEERTHFNLSQKANSKNRLAQRRLRAHRKAGGAAPTRRVTRAEYDAWNRGELEPEPDPEPESKSNAVADPNDSDPDATARDKELVERDAALAKELEEKGVF